MKKGLFMNIRFYKYYPLLYKGKETKKVSRNHLIE